MISNLHIHYYWYYNLRRASPPFIGCLHAAQRKKSPYSEFFWSACSAFGLNIQSECGKIRTLFTQCSVQLKTCFDHYKLLLTTIYYFLRPYTTFDSFWRLYNTFDGYILPSTATYYLRRLCTTFSLTWLWFCKNSRLPCNFPHLWIER